MSSARARRPSVRRPVGTRRTADPPLRLCMQMRRQVHSRLEPTIRATARARRLDSSDARCRPPRAAPLRSLLPTTRTTADRVKQSVCKARRVEWTDEARRAWPLMRGASETLDTQQQSRSRPGLSTRPSIARCFKLYCTLRFECLYVEKNELLSYFTTHSVLLLSIATSDSIFFC